MTLLRLTAEAQRIREVDWDRAAKVRFDWVGEGWVKIFLGCCRAR
jgi:hypothetical protein